MTNLNVESLRIEVAGLDKKMTEMDAATLRLRKLTEERRLSLYEATGDGNSLHAAWIRAWLRDDHEEARRILVAMYPKYEPATPLRLVPATPFDAEAAADAESVSEFGARAYGCVMSDEPAALVDLCDPADDEMRSSHGR